MSCISVQTKRNGGVSVAAVNKGGIFASSSRMGGISVSVGLVCDVGLQKFLRVTPESVQWITVEMPIDYNVESNVIWNIQ